jgi:hypothetical protein
LVKRLIFLFVVSFTVPAVASADPFSATLAGIGQGAGVTGVRNGSFFSVWAGEIKWTSDGALGDFLSYCVQLDSAATNPQYFVPGVGGMISTSQANQISYLFSTNSQSITNGWMAAGLQLAIWNVLYDSDYSAGDGTFRSYSANAVYYADQFLLNLSKQANPTGNALFLDSVTLDGRSSRSGQDQVTSPVPEPTTLLLLGTGVALATRRRLKRNT